MLAVGVDAYARGWVGVTLEDGCLLRAFTAASFVDVLRALPTAAATASTSRSAFRRTTRAPQTWAARAFVGPRASSVFPTPTRVALSAETYGDALVAQRAAVGVGLSKQAYALRTRILEVDRASGDERVFEVHPEVSFTELAGTPLAAKRTPQGREQRRQALGGAGIDLSSVREPVPLVDLLDAAAWTANRYASGRAKPLPERHATRIGAIWR